MPEVHMITVGTWRVNCYVVSDEEGRCVVIDPGEDPAAIDEALIIPKRLSPTAMVATHGHLDHVGGARYFTRKYSAPLYIHAADLVLAQNATYWAGVLGTPGITDPDRIECVGEGRVSIGAFALAIIHTPGHTAGGICIYLETQGVVFTGDTLLLNTVGRSDRPGLDSGGHEALIESIKTRLFRLPDETMALPGHGGSTTIGHEKLHNSYLI